MALTHGALWKLETLGDPVQSFPNPEQRQRDKKVQKQPLPTRNLNSLPKAKAFVWGIPLRVGEWAGSVLNAPAPFLGHRLSVANQRARPWRRKPEAESGGLPGPREAGRGRRSCGPRRSWTGGSGGRCGGGAKTAGMVGRENELSIHFVPGSCRLVEVRESARGSRRNRECRGGRARSRGLE